MDSQTIHLTYRIIRRTKRLILSDINPSRLSALRWEWILCLLSRKYFSTINGWCQLVFIEISCIQIYTQIYCNLKIWKFLKGVQRSSAFLDINRIQFAIWFDNKLYLGMPISPRNKRKLLSLSDINACRLFALFYTFSKNLFAPVSEFTIRCQFWI